jgi:hypothetical protein
MFEESNRLKEIIESFNWTLYDTSPIEGHVPTWEEFAERGPATVYEIGKNYIFAPIPKEGQTLREAYAPTRGNGPSLRIENIDDPRWVTLYIPNFMTKNGPRPALFSRLFFHEEGVAATSPPNPLIKNPDLVGIAYPYLIDTFEKYFGIVPYEEIRLTNLSVIAKLN